MVLALADFQAAAQHAADGMRGAEDELNAADARLGDGDTGQTMRRVAEGVANAAAATSSPELGGFFRQLGMAGMAATGSSLGTLVSIGLIEIGKSFKDRDTVDAADLALALATAEAAMLARGKTQLGDKTALDVLHAIATALATDPEDAVAALAAAKACLDALRDQPCRIGRARMYADKSIGMDDPGMLAFVRLAESIVTR